MQELLKKIVAIPSFSREEKDVADFLENHLREDLTASQPSLAGCTLHRHLNNIWVEGPSAGCLTVQNDANAGTDCPVILLNAHIDTVRPSEGWTTDPFNPVEKDGCIYGLGTNDDGASLVTMWEAFKRLCSKPQPYKLIFSATAEEEVGGTGGIEQIIPLIGRIDLGIIGEPTGMDMAVAEKGLMVLDCTACGVSGHAAREEGVNALYKAMDDIEWFRGYSFDKVSEVCGKVKMSVTQIEAGSQHNVVPDLCSFVVDIRSNGLYKNTEILDIVKAHVNCLVKPRSTRHNGASIPSDHPVVKRGLSLGLGTFGSPTTSNRSVCPFTTLKIGPGDSSRSHGANEFIRLVELADGAEKYYKLLDGMVL